MLVAIITAEVAFWVLLLGGLTLRYVARAGKLSSIVLAVVPLVDLALVIFVAIDIAGGAPPTQAHALAAIYLGFTVAFGHSLITSVDARFRHRFAGGPAVQKPEKGSAAAVRALWTEWFRVVLAAAIAAAGLGLMILVEGDGIPTSFDEATEHPYWATMYILGLITVIWFLAGPAFARRSPVSSRR